MALHGFAADADRGGGVLAEVRQIDARHAGRRIVGVGRQALAHDARVRRRALRLAQAGEQILGLRDMQARGIARQIELDEPALAPAARHAPQEIVDVRVRRRRRPVRLADLGEHRSHVRRVRPVGVAIDIEGEQPGIALAAGEPPELGLGRSFARRVAGEIELARQRRVFPGDLRPAGRSDDVAAHRDHHAGNVDAGRRHVPEQRLRERAVAAAAVERDGVGLRREGDQKSRRVADARQARRSQRDVGIFQRIVAASVEKHEMDAGALGLRVEHVVEMNRVFLDVVDGVQSHVDRNEIIVGGNLQAVAAVIEEGNVGRRRAPAEVGDGALHLRLVEIDAERHREA